MGGKMSSLSLNLVVNEAEKRVVLAEANRDFVDVLLSSLVTPVGAAVKVVGRTAGLGCMDSLYKSVANLDDKTFQTKYCKQMLLDPPSANRANCYNLVEHINPTSFRYHTCTNQKHHNFWSAMHGVSCPTCGETMGDAWINPYYADGSPKDAGVFLKGASKYLITEDLRVSVFGSMTAAAGEMRRNGFDDLSKLTEKNEEFGREELLKLFSNALSSKTPLTDTFLRAEGENTVECETVDLSSLIKKPSDVEPKSNKMTIDLVFSKTTGKFLYAEANEDIVNLFFSFLTFPFGLICNLYNGSFSIGCISNLWSSAKVLTEQGKLRTNEHSDMLLRPKLAPHHSFDKQILKIEEGESSVLFRDENITFYALNPKSPSRGGGFVKEATTFIITDDLTIKKTSISDGLAIIRNNDIEAITVTVGELEALKLLKASLTSRTPLTTVFKEVFPTPYINQNSSNFRPGILINKRLQRRSNLKKLEDEKEI